MILNFVLFGSFVVISFLICLPPSETLFLLPESILNRGALR